MIYKILFLASALCSTLFDQKKNSYNDGSWYHNQSLYDVGSGYLWKNYTSILDYCYTHNWNSYQFPKKFSIFLLTPRKVVIIRLWKGKPSYNKRYIIQSVEPALKLGWQSNQPVLASTVPSSVYLCSNL